MSKRFSGVNYDPLRFFRQMCERYSVDLEGIAEKFERFGDPFNVLDGSDFIYSLEFPEIIGKEEKDGWKRSTILTVDFMLTDRFPVRLEDRFLDFMEGRRYKNGLPSINLKKHEMSFFGQYQPYLTFGVYYSQDWITESGKRVDEQIYHIDITSNGKMNDYGFCRIQAMRKNRHLEKEFTDIHALKTKDYRPYLQRFFELYNHSKEFHDPIIYSPNNKGRKDFENAIDQSIALLFTGKEKEEFENMVRAHRLKVSDNWSSVPRMNLGLVNLPTPNNGSNVNDGSYVLDSANLLVDYAVMNGLAERENIERLVARKLLNRLVNDQGFQLSRDHATKVINSLQKSSYSYKARRVA